MLLSILQRARLPRSAACDGPGGVESALIVTGASIGDVADHDHTRPPDPAVEINQLSDAGPRWY